MARQCHLVTRVAGVRLLSTRAQPTADETMRACVGDFVVSGPEYGHGAYGRVLSAKNPRTGESVACKVIGPVVHDVESDKAPAVSEAEIYASANAELEALRRLQVWPHRNVIGFRGDHLLHTPRGPATLLFLELADGGDLVDMLLKAPGSLLSEDVARDYFRQMTAGSGQATLHAT